MKKVSFTELYELLKMGKEKLAVTGSVAFFILTGFSPEEALQRANDVDIITVEPLTDEENQQIRTRTRILNDKNGQEIVFIPIQESSEVPTQVSDLVRMETPLGELTVVSIERMVAWEVERLNKHMHSTEAEMRPEYLKKRMKKLKQRIPFVSSELAKEAKRKLSEGIALLEEYQSPEYVADLK